jgi:beta-glucanase (GH16 family)
MIRLLKPINVVAFAAVVTCHGAFGQCFDNTTTTITKDECIPCNDQTWILQYEDNFDGKELSSKNWIFPYQGVLAGFDYSSSGSKTWYANTGSTPMLPLSNNIQTENGILKLIARKESTPIVGKYVVNWSTTPPTKDSSAFQYSSAWIESQQLFGYGKYEARIKIPNGKGLWPAFWLFNGLNNHRYEIDIFEFWNETNCLNRYKKNRLSKNPHFALHGDSINRGSSQCTDDLFPCYGNWGNSKIDYSADFHVYVLEWDYYKILWYIDGKIVHSLYRFSGKGGKIIDCNTVELGAEYKTNESWPFTDEMQVRFNLGIQYNKGDYEVNSGSDFPGAMEVDYFRFYQKIAP